jgi:predicted CXXCH cytochrome family protein
MSKLKLSFSFILVLFLVGMFSAVAFAASSTGTNPVTGNDKNATDLKTNLPDIDTVGKGDNGLNNSNLTGDDASGQLPVAGHSVKKNVSGQKTHGEYQNNTNSCASCHQTHTGASAGLLFKNGEYATCTACHDGTLGYLNVFETDSSKILSATATGGTFAGTAAGNMSAHMSDGSVKLAAAPGGNHTPGANDEAWNADFTCASCHAPHGSYSDRLLHENPNNMGTVPTEEGGKKLEDVTVVDSLGAPDETSPEFVVLRTTLAQDASATYPDATVGPVYTAKGLKSGDMVLQLYSRQETVLSTGNTYSWKAETDPWLHGYEFDDTHSKHYWTAFTSSNVPADVNTAWATKYGVEPITTDNLKQGEVLGTGFIAFKSPSTTNLTYSYLKDTDSATKATGKKTDTVQNWVTSLTSGNLARAYVVNMVDADTTHDGTKGQPNTYNKKADYALWSGGVNAGKGVAMSAYCSACHTDYLAKSAGSYKEEGITLTEGTGTFSKAYRHTTMSDSYTCIRCHYAHGTDETIMRDSQAKSEQQIIDDPTYLTGTPKGSTQAELDARTAAVKAYLLDKNPSSALKRYTNMAVCWGCHTSSHSEGTRNTGSYEYGSGAGETLDGNGLPTGF